MKGLAGSLLGALLTVAAWKLFAVSELAPRLLIAFVAFLIVHGVQRLVQGSPRGAPPPEQTGSSNVPLIVAAVAALVIASVVTLKWMELRSAERAMKQPEERAVIVEPSVEPAPMRPSIATCAGTSCTLTGPATAVATKELVAKGFHTELVWEDVTADDLATAGALSQVQALTISFHEGVTDASGLAKLTSLRSLRIPGSLPSLAFVATLAHLEALYLAGRGDISVALEVDRLSGKFPEDDTRFAMLRAQPARRIDLAPLSGLKALKELDFSLRGVFDLTPLSGLTALETLQMNGVPVASVAPLRTLVSLKRLSTAKLPARDLAPLGELAGLEELDLEAAAATDYAFIGRLKKLATLVLTFAELADLAPIAELPSLTRLDLAYTKVKSWSPLASLSSAKTLENLSLEATSFSEIAILEKLPNLRVLSVPSGVDLTAYRKAHPKVLAD